MAKDPIWALKLLVYGMGIFLVGGFIWLGLKLTFKASELGNKRCEEVKIEAPLPTQPLLDVRYEEDDIVLVYKDIDRLTLYRYDRCGSLKQTVKVRQASPLASIE